MLISFSAIDGAGKTTQIEILRLRLANEGRKVRVLWSRGGYTPRFEALKGLARKLMGRKLPSAGHSKTREAYLKKRWVSHIWLALAIVDLAITYGVQIRWWRARGFTVICDRYLWDTAVDYRINFRGHEVEKSFLWKLLVAATPKPSVAIAMWLSVEQSAHRCSLKYDPFPDPEHIRIERHALYAQIFAQGDWIKIDANQTIPEVAALINSVVEAKSR